MCCCVISVSVVVWRFTKFLTEPIDVIAKCQIFLRCSTLLFPPFLSWQYQTFPSKEPTLLFFFKAEFQFSLLYNWSLFPPLHFNKVFIPTGESNLPLHYTLPSFWRGRQFTIGTDSNNNYPRIDIGFTEWAGLYSKVLQHLLTPGTADLHLLLRFHGWRLVHRSCVFQSICSCCLVEEISLDTKFHFSRPPSGILGERFESTCIAEPSDHIFSS